MFDDVCKDRKDLFIDQSVRRGGDHFAVFPN